MNSLLEQAKKSFSDTWLFGWGDKQDLINRINNFPVLTESCKSEIVDGIRQNMESPMISVFLDLENQSRCRIFI